MINLQLLRLKKRSILNVLFYTLLLITTWWSLQVFFPVIDFTSFWGLFKLWFVGTFIWLIASHRTSSVAFIVSYTLVMLVPLFCAPVLKTYELLNLKAMFLLTYYSNPSEAGEFVSLLSGEAILVSVLLCILSILVVILHLKIKVKDKSKINAFLWFLALLLFLKNPIQILAGGNELSRRFESKFVQEYYSKGISNNILGYYLWNVYLVAEEVISFNVGFDKPITWQVKREERPHKNYILVVGESASADYMSLYGYTYPNSTFLDSVSGAKISLHYYSPAANTANSLIRSFIWKGGDPDIYYPDNLVTLAKSAGLRVYWLSSQKEVEGNRSPISRIASFADWTEYVSKSIVWDGRDKDSDVLPVLKQMLQEETQEDKLIIIHIMGSHQEYSKRLEKPLYVNHYNKEVSEYMQTLEQTDELLRRIYEMASLGQRPFSMMYFSDHGQSRRQGTDGLSHGATLSTYHTPMLQIDSDEIGRTTYDGRKNGRNFLHAFATWLGIIEPRLEKGFTFFTPSPLDSVDIHFSPYEINVRFKDIQDEPILGK